MVAETPRQKYLTCGFAFTQIPKVEETNKQLIAALKAEKEEVELSLNKEKMQTQQLRQELIEAETRNTDQYKVTFSSSVMNTIYKSDIILYNSSHQAI